MSKDTKKTPKKTAEIVKITKGCGHHHHNEQDWIDHPDAKKLIEAAAELNQCSLKDAQKIINNYFDATSRDWFDAYTSKEEFCTEMFWKYYADSITAQAFEEINHLIDNDIFIEALEWKGHSLVEIDDMFFKVPNQYYEFDKGD